MSSDSAERDIDVTLPKKWIAEFPANGREGELLSLRDEKQTRISVVRTGAECTARLWIPPYEDRPILLHGPAADLIRLCYTGNRAALYSGEALIDEDWPIGTLPDKLYGTVFPGVVITGDVGFDEAYLARGEDRIFASPGEYRPSGTDTSCGDCMPYTDPADQRVHLFFLYDRRHHKSKYGLGAHQWGHMSTSDGRLWQTEPMAIAVEEQWEGSVCTGSVIEDKGLYFAFYAVRMSDRSPARLTCAISEDCRHFKKTGEYISLAFPYEAVSARDPKVYGTADGKFHMLVTTSVGDRGALAHLVSDDLRKWEQLEPFAVMENAEQPECADYFIFGKYQYLVYSLYGAAHYFFRSSDSEAWRCPKNNVVVAPSLRVPKAAMLKDHLVFAGFVLDEGEIYGGRIELYEAAQRENGELEFKRFVPEETRNEETERRDSTEDPRKDFPEGRTAVGKTTESNGLGRERQTVKIKQ